MTTSSKPSSIRRAFRLSAHFAVVRVRQSDVVTLNRSLFFHIGSDRVFIVCCGASILWYVSTAGSCDTLYRFVRPPTAYSICEPIPTSLLPYSVRTYCWLAGYLGLEVAVWKLYVMFPVPNVENYLSVVHLIYQ